MTAGLAKLLPLFLCWTAMAFVASRFCREQRKEGCAALLAGFFVGVATATILAMRLRGEPLFLLFRGVTAALFLLLLLISLAFLYRSLSGARSSAPPWPSLASIASAAVASLFAGAFCAMSLPLQGGLLSLPRLVLPVAGVITGWFGCLLERRLLRKITLTPASFLLAQTSLLLLISSHMPRLDLFAPLAMKVMKFIHDFVHQFFESMLIPDHPFFRLDVWDYIGLLFSNEVGFWGGLLIWFVPPLALLLSFWRERLPSVAHVRQGAERRRLVASAMRERRWRLLIPWLSVLFLALAVYRSSTPVVEYWDPKPIPVTAAANREIFIPMKGEEYDLGDGKLHKFLLREGKAEARFFVLMKESGKLAVTLDACSICQPEGYGQSEGTVVCYYCKTLIPLETVGEPGGCNPVPVPFSETGAGVRLSAATLLNAWSETVQSTKKVPGGER